MPSTSPLYWTAVKLLADGPRQYEELLYLMSKTIPPGRAVRYNEYARVATYKRRKVEIPPRIKNTNQEERIRSGSRELARRMITNSPRFVIYVIGGVKWVQDCPTPGMNKLTQKKEK